MKEITILGPAAVMATITDKGEITNLRIVSGRVEITEAKKPAKKAKRRRR